MDPENDLDVLVDDLDVNIDELTTALAPLLSQPIHKTAATLPLLDKAKFYVFSAYAIESLLFSTLQASGVNAKEHAVFRELARLKGYMGKITQAEEAGEGGKQQQPKVRLNKEAAARFIKHGLAGNERYDLERAERIAKEKARAALRARQMHVKFDQKAEEEKQAELIKKRKAEEMEQEEESSSEEEAEAEEEENHVESENEDFYGNEALSSRRPRKKSRVSASDVMEIDSNDDPSSSAITPTKRPKKSKKDKKRKNSTVSNPTSSAAEPSTPTSDAAPQSQPPSKEERRASKRAKKTANRLSKIQSLGGRRKKSEELVLPDRSQQAPKTRSEMFSALLDGSFAEQKREKEKAKKGKK